MSGNKSKRRREDYVKMCVECDSTLFHYEEGLREISCLKCGLVLASPPTTDFITDGFRYVKKSELT